MRVYGLCPKSNSCARKEEKLRRTVELLWSTLWASGSAPHTYPCLIQSSQTLQAPSTRTVSHHSPLYSAAILSTKYSETHFNRCKNNKAIEEIKVLQMPRLFLLKH